MLRLNLLLFVTCGVLLGLLLPFRASAENAPKTPHQIQGRESCTMCHKVGGVGVRAVGGIGMPDDHLNRTDNICESCHPAAGAQVGGGGAGATRIAAAAASPTAAPTPVATVEPTSVVPPAGANLPLAAVPQATVAAATEALPSAGEPLEDLARAAPFFAAALLFLLGAAALQRLLARGA